MKTMNKILVLSLMLCFSLSIGCIDNTNTEETKGTIRFSSNPSGAEIYLNTDYYNMTNTVFENVNLGTYTVVFKKAGYEDFVTSVTVTADGSYHVFTTLVPI